MKAKFGEQQFDSFEDCVAHMMAGGSCSEKSAKQKCSEIFNAAEFADFNSEWIEIFRAGDYGDKGAWTEEQIDQVVRNFAAGAWKPPAVIGHPTTDAPAMAWIESLRRDGKTLLAKFGQVQPELEKVVKSGRFPNRSAAFYTDPQGKGPVLRHVGFLGATPPEVKGLGPIKFASTEFSEIDFLEDVSMDETKKTIKEEIKAFFADIFGAKPAAGAAYSEADVKRLIVEGVQAATGPLIEQNKALVLKVTELSNKVAADNSSALRARAFAEIEKLKAAKKWIPAFDANGAAALMEHLAVSGAEVTFGEAGKEKKYGAFDAFVSLLNQLPAIVPTGKITAEIKTGSGKVVKFNESRGVEVDVDSVAINDRALKIQAERKIDFGEALRIAAEELGA